MALRDELLGVLILVFAGLMAGCGGGDSQECQSDADCADGLVCRDHECVEPDDPCAGVVCDSPPDDFCSDPDTLTTYTSNGTCDEGQCTYSSSEVPCNDGCLEQPGDDVCEGDPCAGVICDQIPADYCFDPDMLHTYTGTGHCQSGACIYDYDDVHCPNGCADGACIGCVPSCAGKCGGPDGCGDRCPDTCTGGRVCRGPEYTFCASRGAVEVLGRGLVALPKDGGIYLGWRLLPWDDPQVGFNLYRAESAAGPFTTLVNSSPVTGSTNFHDTGVQASSTWWYVVRTVATGGAEGPDSNLARATAGSTRNRIDIAMAPTPDCPSGLNWDASSWGGVTPGDVNGDGMLDFVLLMLDRDNHSHPYCIELFLSRDGGWVSSWRVPTGYPANRDSSVVVRDFDGDGRAEIFTRAEAGGNLCRLDAETGAVAESVPWPYSQGGLGYGMLVHAWLEDADQDGFPEPFVLTQNGMYLDPPQNPRFTAWRWDPDSGFTKRRDVTFSAAGFDEDHP